MKTSVFLAAMLVIVFALPAPADPGPPDPISMDRESPSVVMFGETPGNIYDMPTNMTMPPAFPQGWDVGGPGPVVHVFDVGYGLITPDDNNDAHSNNELSGDNDQSPDVNQILYFSGDDWSMGQPGTDYENQAIRVQAAGDRFMVNGITTRTPVQVMTDGLGPSSIGPRLFPGGLGNFPTNLLSANQHRYHEIPSIGPAAVNTFVPREGATLMDDMDALELTSFNMQGEPILNTPIYFSLDPPSPTLWNNWWFPSDILVTPPGMIPNVQLFAPAQSMGLMPEEDDIDALAVWDYVGEQGELFMVDPTLDYALFSLAPGSFSLLGPDGAPGTADDLSAADIFVTDFTGMHALYLPHRDIGMTFEDNVDAIDVEPQWMFQEPLDWVSPLPDPDSDGDGDVDGHDFLTWQRGFGKFGPGLTPADGDFDWSQVVDHGDLAIWEANFGMGGLPLNAGAAGVPEPASLGLCVIGLAAVLFTAQRMRRR